MSAQIDTNYLDASKPSRLDGIRVSRRNSACRKLRINPGKTVEEG
jgi:hypothetical protein